MSDFSDTSAGPNLALGTKIAFLVAIPFIAYGLFNLFTPISEVRTEAGAVFACGTAVKPPADEFQSGVCRDINQEYLYRGIASGAAGLGIALGGYFLFTTRVGAGTGRDNDEFDDWRGDTRGTSNSPTARTEGRRRLASDERDRSSDRRRRNVFDYDDDDEPTSRRRNVFDDE